MDAPLRATRLVASQPEIITGDGFPRFWINQRLCALPIELRSKWIELVAASIQILPFGREMICPRRNGTAMHVWSAFIIYKRRIILLVSLSGVGFSIWQHNRTAVWTVAQANRTSALTQPNVDVDVETQRVSEPHWIVRDVSIEIRPRRFPYRGAAQPAAEARIISTEKR